MKNSVYPKAVKQFIVDAKNGIGKVIIPFTSFVNKGWGVKSKIDKDPVGEIVAYHSTEDEGNVDGDFCSETVKVLYFEQGKRLSRHFHKNKSEIFLCALGTIELEIWDDQGPLVMTLVQGDRVYIPAKMQHRMRGIDSLNILVEISTLDTPEDSYRIEKGD